MIGQQEDNKWDFKKTTYSKNESNHVKANPYRIVGSSRWYTKFTFSYNFSYKTHFIYIVGTKYEAIRKKMRKK